MPDQTTAETIATHLDTRLPAVDAVEDVHNLEDGTS